MKTPIAKRIIEGHGGRIRASRLLPGGASLVITLPRGKEEEEDASGTDR